MLSAWQQPGQLHTAADGTTAVSWGVPLYAPADQQGNGDCESCYAA
jgi:hypothetical protein